MGGYSYMYYRACGCPRCRCRGIMGPTILVTLGILFLLETFNIIRFHYTWPVILIVIGLVKVLQSNAPMTGHGGYIETATVPPAAAPAGDEGQVHHG